jgi:hypothetical protein
LKVTLKKPAKAKPGDIVRHINAREDFFGIVTAYGINDTCVSKAWVRVYWTSAASIYGEVPEINFHPVRELEVANGGA